MYDPIGPLVTSYRCVCVDRAGDGVSSDACWSGPTSRGWIPPDVRFTRVADTAIRCFVCIHVDLVGGSGRCRGEAIRTAACKSNRSRERSDHAHPTSTQSPPTPFATRTKRVLQRHASRIARAHSPFSTPYHTHHISRRLRHQVRVKDSPDGHVQVAAASEELLGPEHSHGALHANPVWAYAAASSDSGVRPLWGD